jgi:hypothetical protein
MQLMRARNCAGCGAPLTAPESGEAWVCRFCGVTYDPDTPSAAPQVRVVTIDARPKANPVVAVLILLVFAAVAIAALVGWRFVRPAHSLDAPYTPAAGKPIFPTRAAVKPSDLHDLKTGGYRPLTVAAPAGGYGALDPVAALPWALAIAQSWESDATFERIDIARLRPDGTVNAQDDKDASVQYRFASPARRQQLQERAELSSYAESVIGMWIRVQNGQPEVNVEVRKGMFLRIHQDEFHPHPQARALPEVMREPAVRRALKPVPFFTAYLIYIDREGWCWYVSTLANESMPRIRARDGAVWPYPR